MRFDKFYQTFSLPVFSAAQSGREAIQLARWVKAGRLVRLKRGVYRFTDREVDEFSLAGYLYSPSYISLETALNNQGIIPDVNTSVTSVSPTTTKMIKTIMGNYYFAKIQADLFWGWQTISDNHQVPYKIALPEKALLDWVYLRKIRNLSGQRVDLSHLSKTRLTKFARQFPEWVRKVINEQPDR